MIDVQVPPSAEVSEVSHASLLHLILHQLVLMKYIYTSTYGHKQL